LAYEHIIAELERIKPKQGSIKVMKVSHVEIPRLLAKASDRELKEHDGRIGTEGYPTPEEIREACHSTERIVWVDDGL
jgi:hypothetical protein